jgi:hypothetical protein
MNRLDWFRDSAVATARVLDEYTAELAPVLSHENRLAAFEAVAKLQDLAFRLIYATDVLHGVTRVEYQNEKENKNGSEIEFSNNSAFCNASAKRGEAQRASKKQNGKVVNRHTS